MQQPLSGILRCADHRLAQHLGGYRDVQEGDSGQHVIDQLQHFAAQPAQVGGLDPPGDAVEHSGNLDDGQGHQNSDRHDDHGQRRQQCAGSRQAGAQAPVEPIEQRREQIRPDRGDHDQHEVVAQEIRTEQQCYQGENREGALLSEREFGVHTNRAALHLAVELNLSPRRWFWAECALPFGGGFGSRVLALHLVVQVHVVRQALGQRLLGGEQWLVPQVTGSLGDREEVVQVQPLDRQRL